MDLESAVKFIEGYLRDYVRYLLRLFSKVEARRQAREAVIHVALPEDAQASARLLPPEGLQPAVVVERVTDVDGKLLTYALISVTIGVLLQRTFISGDTVDKIDFPHAITVEVCFWFAITLVVHLTLNFRRHTSDFSDSLSAIFSVIPPAFVAAAYSTFVIFNIDRACQSLMNEPYFDYYARWDASLADAAIQWLLVLFYLPGAISARATATRLRVGIATFAAVFVMALVDCAILLNTGS